VTLSPNLVSELGLEQVADDVYVRPMLTLDDAIDLYLGDLARRGKAQRTRDTYRRTLDDFADTLPNHWDVAKIGPDDVRRFLDRYNRDRYAPAYRAKQDSIVRGLFHWLYVTERIKRSPMEKMLPPKRQDPEDVDVVSVSTDQVRGMFGLTQNWTEKLALAVVAGLGPRRAAAAKLRLSDYDQIGRRLRFKEKGGTKIWKPVTHELGALIDAAIDAGVYESDDDYLIPSLASQRRPGDRDDRVIWKTVKRIAERAGVECHTHALRAAFAVHFDQAHPDHVTTLKDLLGHKRIETTMVYLRRRDRDAGMELVRDVAWTVNDEANGSPQNAEKPFESLPEAEKEGFEPSFPESRLPERESREHP
jgi:site-specific recombinase XerD